jgi:hypothetical protein
VKSKEAGVKIQECGEDVSDSEEETTLQRVTSPDKRSKMKKKSGLVLRYSTSVCTFQIGIVDEHFQLTKACFCYGNALLHNNCKKKKKKKKKT